MKKSPMKQGMLGAALNLAKPTATGGKPNAAATKDKSKAVNFKDAIKAKVAEKKAASAGPRPKAPTKTTKATTPATQLKKHKR